MPDLKKKNKGIGVYILMVVGLLIFATILFTPKQTINVSYFDIVDMFNDKKVDAFKLDLNSSELTLIVAGKKEPIIYKIPSVEKFLEDVDVNAYRDNYNANHSKPMPADILPVKQVPFLLTMLPTFLLVAVMIGFWVMFMRQAGGGNGKVMNFGKVKAKPNENTKVTFDDVAGADEEKEELQEVVGFLKNPQKYNSLGAKIPKGVLLVGPPGTGKTLIAKAVAGEAGVPFFSISGSDFVEMFVGVGASRVRDLFEQAKAKAPAIIFIDEIDAVGRQRGAGLGGGHDEREQTLNQLLVEMDGFTENTGIIIIAATNRRDILDPALLRPGRFDRQVIVNYPDIKGREEILKVHAKNKPIAPDVDLRVIAKSTSGFTGADLANLLNEAALLASRKDRKAITKADIEEATIKVMAGPEKKSQVVTEEDKKLTAYHEAGHAICTYVCEKNSFVHQVSIIPRGMAGGYTMSLPIEDRNYQTKKQMNQRLIGLLGGRVAEKLILDDISTGASNDLERASGIARAMVTRYGFSEKLGPIVYGEDQSEVFLGRDLGHTRNYSENIAAEIDQEVRRIIDNAYEKTKAILTENMELLHKTAKYLMEFEKISGESFKRLMQGDDTVFEDAKSSIIDETSTEASDNSVNLIIDDTTELSDNEIPDLKQVIEMEESDEDIPAVEKDSKNSDK